MDTKTCSRCRQMKPLSEFKSDSRKPDRKASSCKACNMAVGYASTGSIAEMGIYDQARALLAQAKAVDEVKAILDKSAALKEYARRAADRTLEIDASEIRFYAERRMGEMLIAQKQTIGFNAGTRGQLKGRSASGSTEKEAPEDGRPTLAEVGISTKLSSHAQKMAAVPAEEFQARVDAWRTEVAMGQSRVTMDLMRIGEAEQKKKAREAREKALGEVQCALPNKRYGVILADPEWRFEPYSRDSGMDRAADNHYPTSATDVIASRPIQTIAADDCALFLWATVPMLPDALRVMEAWSFTYKSHFIWNKDKIGTGYWNRNKHELLLVGTRGNIPAPAMGEQTHSVIDAPVRLHSEKPQCFYLLIESYFPNLPKIELNARKARAGWTSWGNEAPQPGEEAA